MEKKRFYISVGLAYNIVQSEMFDLTFIEKFLKPWYFNKKKTSQSMEIYYQSKKKL